jgi:hypothetical protein
MKTDRWFFLIVFFIVSCNKDRNNALDTVFPDKIGDQWIYKFTNGNSSSRQFIYVDIAGSSTLPDGRAAMIWNTSLHDSLNNISLIGTEFVVANNEDIIFYEAPCQGCPDPVALERRRYKFPLRVKNEWFTSSIFGDTTKVLSWGNITVPGGTFPNTFLLFKNIGYVTNSYTRDSIWLTPGIGMTRFYQNEFILGLLPGNGVWELDSYTIK